VTTRDNPGKRFAPARHTKPSSKARLPRGCRFFAGYPITPATGNQRDDVHPTACRGWDLHSDGGRNRQHGRHHRSISGRGQVHDRHQWSGFSLMQENLGFACIAEVPCVIGSMSCAVDEHRPAHQCQPGRCDAVRWGTHGDHPMIVLAVSTTRMF